MLGLILVLAVGANAQSGTAPSPCCTSNQFSVGTAVTIGKTVNGKGVAQQGFLNMQYDWTNKLLYIESNITDMATQQIESYKILQDINNNQQYVILKDGSCYIQPSTVPMDPPCIPKDAAFMGELTLNSGSGTLVKGNAWAFKIEQQDIKMVVSQDTCTPIMRVATGISYGEEQQITNLYYNQSPGFADASKMVAPTGCTPQPTMGKQCCTSKQFTASVGVSVAKSVNGVGSASKGIERYIYDADAKLVYVESALTEQGGSGKTTAYKVLQDFNTMTSRITLQDGTCYKGVITESMEPACIPNDAQFLGSQTIGSGDRALKTNAFEITQPMGNITMVVEDGTCTPVSETRAGRFYGEDQQRTTMFYDFQPFIDAADRQLLATPANCETPLPTQAPMNQMMTTMMGAPIVG